MRRALAVLVLALTMVQTGVVARAGGTVFSWRDAGGLGYFRPGELVRGSTTFSPDLESYGVPEDGPWYAYLRSGWVQPPRVDEGGVRLGRVAIERLGGGARASLEFIMPDLPAGRYYVQLCNLPCSEQLGDIVGGSLSLIATSAEERLQRQVDALSNKLAITRERLEGRAERLKRVMKDLRGELDGSVASLLRDVRELREDLAPLQAAERSQSGGIGPWAVAIASLVAAGLALLVLRRRAVARTKEVSVPPEWLAGAIAPDSETRVPSEAPSD
ncbi:MAG: hypothetical protein H0V97_02480 [Actinobacteria bacterium]|nr:hypothetical protein [Actinomycetota bacterium]